MGEKKEAKRKEEGECKKERQEKRKKAAIQEERQKAIAFTISLPTTIPV